jgi:hypothetical protein
LHLFKEVEELAGKTVEKKEENQADDKDNDTKIATACFP